MNIRLFNRKYWVRRFGEQKNVRGYLTSTYSDTAYSLHIHPAGNATLQALPEGERSLRRLEGHGEVALMMGNEQTNTKGDLLWYGGDWYECTSCVLYDHTMLNHYNYQFVVVPTDAAGTIDLTEPTGTP